MPENSVKNPTRSIASRGAIRCRNAKSSNPARLARFRWVSISTQASLPLLRLRRGCPRAPELGNLVIGKKGAVPSHPELLDWLACELMEPKRPVESLKRYIVKSGYDSTIQRFNDSTPPPWSLKHIHRLIVTSAIYRQASASRPEATTI